jgi:tetratricopeptide (TPR) repeat protein
MQYHKFIVGDTIIEFHNNWLGEETVILNGKLVSKQSSIRGLHHHFSIVEDGNLARYVLTTKVNEWMMVELDLRRNGELIYENILVRNGSKPKSPPNKDKQLGIIALNEYDLDLAIAHFEKALDLAPEDSEIYFHIACAYSVKENALEGFKALKHSIHFKLADPEIILNHEFLAYLRIHPAFEDFLESGFIEFDESNI